MFATAVETYPEKYFYEYFSGGGMARIGLNGWQCIFANDNDSKKAATYKANFGENEIISEDISKLDVSRIPKGGMLAWASFPCQDLSLAGNQNGINAHRSGTFWKFWEHCVFLKQNDHLPMIVVENVIGLLTSGQGKDFHMLLQAMSDAGYVFGALVIDAKHFLPQSRPRVFVVAIKKGINVPRTNMLPMSDGFWHDKKILKAYNGLPGNLKNDWRWWYLPRPPERTIQLANIIEADVNDWFNDEKLDKLLNAMSESHRQLLDSARMNGNVIGTIYKRTREVHGIKTVRAELRLDGLAGALRTPAGGSSKQIVVFAGAKKIKARFFTARESARLMGMPDSYSIPTNINETYHLTGDGVAVPVVNWLNEHLLTPISNITYQPKEIAYAQ